MKVTLAVVFSFSIVLWSVCIIMCFYPLAELFITAIVTSEHDLQH